MKSQLNEHDVKTACILGIAGGNGLEHVMSSSIGAIYGVNQKSAISQKKNYKTRKYMSNRKIFGLWMSLIGILFGISSSNAENNLIFESDKIIFNRIEMPYRIAHINGSGNPAFIIYLHGGSNKGNDNNDEIKIYNLMGHRLDNRPLAPGIYIINGRKTFIR